MNDKLRNKLNNVLKGLILSKEQKKELVEVFEELSTSTSGNNDNELLIDLDEDNNTIKINNVIYNVNPPDSESNVIIIDNDLTNYVIDNDIKHSILYLHNSNQKMSLNSIIIEHGFRDNPLGRRFVFLYDRHYIINIVITNQAT